MNIKDKILEYIFTYGMQVVGAALILTLGFLAARWVGGILQRSLEKREMEPPLRSLVTRVTRMVLIAFTGVLALAKFGVDVAPLVAGIGVVGVGVGLATQGVLSNVFAGLMLIFTRPYRVGEYIEILGVHGRVEALEVFSTVLTHPDRSRVIIPNRKVIGEVLHNYGTIRQLDLSIGVAYATDLGHVVEVLNGVLAQNSRVLKEPAPVIGVSDLGDSSINLKIRPWVAVPDYAEVTSELYRQIIERFRACGIEMPYPQREIRVLSGPAAGAA